MIPRILSNTKNATSTVSSVVDTDLKQERALVIMAKYLKPVYILSILMFFYRYGV
jgi:hypothetical protein